MSDKRAQVTISTDGACSGNPGPGGFAAVLRFGKHFKEIAGFESRTSNSRMELRAVIESIAALKVPCDVLIRTDSTMVCNAIACLDEMPKNKWQTKTGARRANCDLLQQLWNVKHGLGHTLRYLYVKGHDGDEDNERCDFLAREQIKLNVR